MKDVYLKNKATGEMVPSEKAIRDYYKTHKSGLDAWTDEWEETNITVEGSHIAAPDFTNCIRV